MISARRERNLFVIRLHHQFIYANNDVITALSGWLKAPKGKPPAIVRDFVNSIPKAAKKKKLHEDNDQAVLTISNSGRSFSENKNLKTKGEVHDLERLFTQVSERFFAGNITSQITWGRDTSSLKVRTRRLGAYYRDDDLIVIHPVLDNPYVPEAVVAFTIFHEMLHSKQPEDHRPHNAVFKRAERKHPDYKFVIKWQKDYSYLLNGGQTNKSS
ncbi:MAG: hypothetical protein P9L92_05445 [Candidatus Electryonea clarkiae]|nr:hypothetical protein [Candidatus Electryonea clarkiae]MDP8286723.1 hypothetical protein [Candidatus Electryonea clarkiae]